MSQKDAWVFFSSEMLLRTSPDLQAPCLRLKNHEYNEETLFFVLASFFWDRIYKISAWEIRLKL